MNTFRIPMPDHLVSFAKKEFWPDQNSGPFYIDEKSLLGKFVFSILSDKRKVKVNENDFKSELNITLSDTLSKRSPNLVKLSKLNKFIDNIFKNTLMIWVTAQMQVGSGRWQAVLSFIKHYELNEDECIETLYQYVKRQQNSSYSKNRYAKEGKAEGIIKTDQAA